MRATNRSASTAGAGPKFSQGELSLQLLNRKASFADFISRPPLTTTANSAAKSQTHFNNGVDDEADTSDEVDPHDLLATALFLPQSINVGNHPESPIDNVRRLLEDANVPSSSSATSGSRGQVPPLLCEMLYLSIDDDEDYAGESCSMLWRQTNRWIKYEQTVEGASTRFSKPHITLLTVHSLLQVKKCLKRGLVLLDIEAADFETLARRVTHEWRAGGSIDEENVELVLNVLTAPKMHLVRKKMRKIHMDTSSETIAERRESAQLKTITLQPPAYVLTRKYNAGGNNDSPQDDGEFDDKREDLLYPQLPDIPVPVKFLFILLNPRDNYQNETTGIGRVLGALFSDEIFQKVACCTRERQTLVDSVDEFISQIIAVPPGKCHPDARWDPVDNDSSEIRNVGMLYAHYERGGEDGHEHLIGGVHPAGHEHAEAQRIGRTGRLFGGLVADVKRKVPWFASDFTDFFRGRLSQSLATTVLMFFANISNIITFGAVMERALHHQMAAIENIVCGGLSGVVFGLLAGQPLNILSATGPTLVFERILYDFCLAYHWEFLPFRFWVGVWIAVFLSVLVATDASVLVGLITRFTEEAFATLISLVFIIQAFEKLYEIGHEAPITRHPEEVLHSACHCMVAIEGGGGGNSSHHQGVAFKNFSVGVTKCKELGGTPQGLQCFFKPDVYLFSVLLTFGTFFIATKLNDLRRSAYLTSQLRNMVSDFGVLIAIVSMTALTYFIGLEVPSLKVPSTFRPTLNRSWLVDISAIDGVHVILISSLPALFYTILIVMDQQITAVIVNRKDNRLRKGSGYHLDLLIVTLLMLVCSLFGLPYYVAATVLSVMHLDALKLQRESVAPGEKPRFLGIKEQRLTTVFAHVLIGMSVMLTPIVKLVPLPVLTGIFLYMGITSLMGQQFVQRIQLFFMPVKHMPDLGWLRRLKMRRIHLFTAIQIASIVALFAVKYASTVSMMFPLMLVVMVLIRIHLLPRIFTKKELETLDDRLPSFKEVWRPLRRRAGEKRLESGVPVTQISLKPLVKPPRNKMASTPTSAERNGHPTVSNGH